MTFQEHVEQLIADVLQRIPSDMPDYGDFIPILAFFDNPDPTTRKDVGKYGLRIYKMAPEIVPDMRKRYIEASAYDPTGAYKATMIVGSGSKDEVSEIIASKDFPVELNKTFGELLELMED